MSEENQNDKIFITKEQALKVISKTYHSFLNPSIGTLVGTNMAEDELIDLLNKAKQIEIAGEVARSMSHGIAIYSSGNKVYFFETDEEKLKALEAELKGLE